MALPRPVGASPAAGGDPDAVTTAVDAAPGGSHALVADRRRRGWLPALVTLLVLLATAVLWLTRPGGDLQGAVTQSVDITGTAGAIQSDVTILQPVRATEDGLKGFAATFGTFRGVTDCALDVSVLDPDRREIARQRVACGDLIDSSDASQVVQFAPIEDSAGKTYMVAYTGAPGRWSEAVTLWVGAPREGTLPATAQGRPATQEVFAGDVATATIAEYAGPGPWAQVWVALERASLGAPWWAQPAAVALWGALLLVGLVGATGAAGTAHVGWRAVTLLVVLVAVCRGLVWASLLPPLEGMDEGAHISYAQFIAEEGRIPVRDQPLEGVPHPYSDQLTVLDQHQRRTAAPPGDRAPSVPTEARALDDRLLAASPRANGASPAAGYPPAYYAPAAALYAVTPGTFEDKVYGMRLWSVVLGGLGAWATVAVTRRLLPTHRLAATVLALAVTIQPMMAHQFAIVNNDALVITAGIAAFAAALRLAQGEVRARWLLVAGALVGAALLAKPYGVGVLPVIGVALLVGIARSGRPAVGTLLRGAAAGAVGLAVTYGVWVAAQRVFGFPSTSLPVSSDGDQSRGGWHYVDLQLADDLEPLRWRWAEHLFGTFAWLDVTLPESTYDVVWAGVRLTVLLVVAWAVTQAVAWTVRAVRSRRLVRADGPARELSNPTRMLLCLGLLAGVFVTLYAAGYLYFRSSGRDELLQGRYALLALPAILALPVLSLEGMASAARVRWVAGVTLAVATVVALGMWALQVLALGTVADRFYL